MIQRIFNLVLILVLTIASKAQICTPDSNLKVDGIFPVVLPHAQLSLAYEQTITVRLFKDTTAKFGTATIPVTIDSMLVLGIVGMPPGLTYNCLTSNCRFLPRVNTCVKISGTPNVADSFPIKIAVRTFGKSGSFPLPPQTDTIRQYYIVVDGKVGIGKSQKSKWNLSPNPVASICIIPKIKLATAPQVFDILGKNVNVTYVYEGNDVILHTEKLASGTYFVHYGSHTAKIIKE